MDRAAISSLVAGLVPLVGVVGIGLGILGLRRIARSGQRGVGLAVAGIVLGGIWVMVGLALVLIDADSGPDRDRNGRVTAGAEVRLEDLLVGDCVTDLGTEESLVLPVVPCKGPHKGEVFEVSELPAGDYPGDEDVDRFAGGRCTARLEDYLGSEDDVPYDFDYYYPSAVNWSEGDRAVICLLVDPDDRDLVGTKRGSGASST